MMGQSIKPWRTAVRRMPSSRDDRRTPSDSPDGGCVVDVVGVLPDVAAEDRRGAMDQRAFAVRGLGDFQLAVLDLQPAPAGAELADTGGGEIGLEFFQPSEGLVDLLFQTAGQLAAAAIGLHTVPE